MQLHIPNTVEFSVANEAWRLKGDAQGHATNEAVRQVAEITKDLGLTQLKLFRLHLIAENQLRSINMEKREPLRFGFETIIEVEDYANKLRKLVDATPKVKAAVETRRATVLNLSKQLVENGILPESALEDVESYVHQQVLMYRSALRRGAGGKGKKSFQKKRLKGEESLGEEYDFDVSYLVPEIAWMSDALYSLEKKRLDGIVEGKYERSKEFISRVEAGEGSLKKLTEDEGYAVISKRDFYGGSAGSLTSRVLMKFEKSVLEDAGLSEEDIIAGEGSEFLVLPKEIVDQVNADAAAGESHFITEMNIKMMNAWKAWTLMNPKRIAGYNIRNFLGDLDPVLAADPRILFEIAESLRDLKKLGTNAPLSGVLRASRDYGVIGSGFAGAEIGTVGNLPLFSRFKEGTVSIAAIQSWRICKSREPVLNSARTSCGTRLSCDT